MHHVNGIGIAISGHAIIIRGKYGGRDHQVVY